MTSLETISYNGHQFNLRDIVGTPKNKLGNNQLGIITHISNRLASNDSNAGFTNITLRMHDGSSKMFELNDLEYIEKNPSQVEDANLDINYANLDLNRENLDVNHANLDLDVK